MSFQSNPLLFGLTSPTPGVDTGVDPKPKPKPIEPSTGDDHQQSNDMGINGKEGGSGGDKSLSSPEHLEPIEPRDPIPNSPLFFKKVATFKQSFVKEEGGRVGFLTEGTPKNINCDKKNQKVKGLGPNCEYQDIGEAAGRQCMFNKRKSCYILYYNAAAQCLPRDSLNEWRTANSFFLAGNIGDTAAKKAWQNGATPTFPADSHCFYSGGSLGYFPVSRCGTGVSGEPCAKVANLILDNCLKGIDKLCGCQQCVDVPEPEEEDPDPKPFGEDTQTSETPTTDVPPTTSTPSVIDEDDDTTPGSIQRQTFTTSSWGGYIPVVFGRMTTRGNVIWVGNKRTSTIRSVHTYTSGSQENTSNTTEEVTLVDILVGLVDSDIGPHVSGIGEDLVQGISKVWLDNKLIYTNALPDDFNPRETEVGDFAIQLPEQEVSFEINFFPGGRAAKDNFLTPDIAYRGLATMGLIGVNVREIGNSLPDLLIEVYTKVQTDTPIILQSETVTDLRTDFLDYAASEDALYISNADTSIALDYYTLKEESRVADNGVAGSKYATRTGDIISQERHVGRAVTRFINPYFKKENIRFGVNDSLLVGHKEGSQLNVTDTATHRFLELAAFGRPKRGPAIYTTPSFGIKQGYIPTPVVFTSQSDTFKPYGSFTREPAKERLLIPSLFDDLMTLDVRKPTQNVTYSQLVSGGAEYNPSSCIYECGIKYIADCITNCQTGGMDCVGGPLEEGGDSVDSIDFDTLVVFMGSETIYTLDYILGNLVFVVGQTEPVGTWTCTGSETPTLDEACNIACLAGQTAYCANVCTDIRIVEAINETSFTYDYTYIGDEQTVSGEFFVIYYRPANDSYSTSNYYPGLTHLIVHMKQASSTLYGYHPEELEAFGTNVDVFKCKLSQSLWGNTSDAYVAFVYSDETHQHVFIKTQTGNDYVIRFNPTNVDVDVNGFAIKNDKVVSYKLPKALPSIYSGGQRVIPMTTKDYAYVADDGTVVVILLATGEVLYNENPGLPPLTGAQIYDPRSHSITYVSGQKITRHYIARARIPGVNFKEITRRLLLKAGLTENLLVFSNSVEDETITGYVVEDPYRVKDFYQEVADIFALNLTDVGVLQFDKDYTLRATVLSTDLLLQTNYVTDKKKGEDLVRSSFTLSSYSLIRPSTPQIVTRRLDLPYGVEKTVTTKMVIPYDTALFYVKQNLGVLYDRQRSISFGLSMVHLKLIAGDVIQYNDDLFRITTTTTTMLGFVYYEASLVTEINEITRLDNAVAPRTLNRLHGAPYIFHTNAVDDEDATSSVAGFPFNYTAVSHYKQTFPAKEILQIGGIKDTDRVVNEPIVRFRQKVTGLNVSAFTGRFKVNLPYVNTNLYWPDESYYIDLDFDRIESADRIMALQEGDVGLKVINDSNFNLIITEFGEQIQFTQAGRINPFVVRITGLLRGRQGTEPLMLHNTRTHSDPNNVLYNRAPRYNKFVYYTPQSVAKTVFYHEALFGNPVIEAYVPGTAFNERERVPDLFLGKPIGAYMWMPVNFERKDNGNGTISVRWQRRTFFTSEERNVLEETEPVYRTGLVSYIPDRSVYQFNFQQRLYNEADQNEFVNFSGIADTFQTFNVAYLNSKGIQPFQYGASQTLTGYVSAQHPITKVYGYPGSFDFPGGYYDDWAALPTRYH